MPDDATEVDLATSVRYVPADYDGPEGPCSFCGNPAPAPLDTSRGPRSLPSRLECTPCWVGRIATECVSPQEAGVLALEMARTRREWPTSKTDA